MVPALEQICFYCVSWSTVWRKNTSSEFQPAPSMVVLLDGSMFGLLLQHTVDDIMATERCSVVEKGNEVWRKTIKLAGWDIPDSKSPTPSSETCLLGADVGHVEHGSELDIIETRLDTLEQLFLEHLNSDQLSAGAAAKLYGRLSATSSQSHGKYGRAKLGPIEARQCNHHHHKLTN